MSKCNSSLRGTKKSFQINKKFSTLTRLKIHRNRNKRDLHVTLSNSSKLVLSLLTFLITIYPCSRVSASPIFATIQLEINYSLPTYQNYDLSSYDNILQLIQEITDGNIRDKSPKQLEHINRILILLVE